MALTPEDVLNKSFTATQFRRGYDEREVDDFLDEVVSELRRLAGEGAHPAPVHDGDGSSARVRDSEQDSAALTEAQRRLRAAEDAAELAERESAERVQAAEQAVAAAEEAERAALERAQAAKEAEQQASERARAAEEHAAAVQAHGGGDADLGQPVEASASTAETGVGTAAGVIALAQKLHDEYVGEGQATRDRLIREGEEHHSRIVAEAEARHNELLGSAQSRHDELLAEATARHDEMLNEARERSSGMVAEAQQRKQALLAELGNERDHLQSTVDQLRAFEADYRSRLTAYIEGQLATLEASRVDFPADGQVRQ